MVSNTRAFIENLNLRPSTLGGSYAAQVHAPLAIKPQQLHTEHMGFISVTVPDVFAHTVIRV